MQLFFDPNAVYSEPLITLHGAEMNHITRVLRHKTGDVINITNGNGTLYQARIENILKDRLNVLILGKRVFDQPEYAKVTLAMPLLKTRDRMEFAIEKAVEIGVGRIILFQSDRTEKHKVRDDRTQGIIESAMKQSLQVYLPRFVICTSLDAVLEQTDGFKLLVAHEKENHSTVQSLDSINLPTVLLVGPEGGFSDKEIEMFEYKNAVIVSLGANRLRSETASIVFLTSIHSKLPPSRNGKGVALYSVSDELN
jgi:16S rRNA (uracil1498-N3)-methyltransferase